MLWSRVKWFLLLFIPEAFCSVWFHSGNFSCKPPHQQVSSAAFCLAVLLPLLLPAEKATIQGRQQLGSRPPATMSDADFTTVLFLNA